MTDTELALRLGTAVLAIAKALGADAGKVERRVAGLERAAQKLENGQLTPEGVGWASAYQLPDGDDGAAIVAQMFTII